MQPNPEFWNCPICGLCKMKYGTSCKKFEEAICENQDQAHITGRYYIGRLNQKLSDAISIGIAQISDESV